MDCDFDYAGATDTPIGRGGETTKAGECAWWWDSDKADASGALRLGQHGFVRTSGNKIKQYNDDSARSKAVGGPSWDSKGNPDGKTATHYHF